jgi:hypothetical protein
MSTGGYKITDQRAMYFVLQAINLKREVSKVLLPAYQPTKQTTTTYLGGFVYVTNEPHAGADMQQREKWRWRICAYRDLLFGKSHFIVFTT